MRERERERELKTEGRRKKRKGENILQYGRLVLAKIAISSIGQINILKDGFSRLSRLVFPLSNLFLQIVVSGECMTSWLRFPLCKVSMPFYSTPCHSIDSTLLFFFYIPFP